LRFLFCDRILALEPGKHALSTKTISIGDGYLTQHYARRAIMPATLALECLAQLAGWLYVVTENYSITVVLALVQGIDVLRHPRPGDTLTLEAWMDFVHRGGATIRGEARVGEEIILRARRLIFASQPSKPEDVPKTKAMFDYVNGGLILQEGART